LKTVWTLIDSIFELLGLIGDDISKWSLQDFEDNPPRLLRLRIVDVLSDIFLPDMYQGMSIEFKVNSILKGDFIDLRKYDDYCGVFEDMDKLISKSKFHLCKCKGARWDVGQLRHNYRKLIHFKTLARPLIEFNSGILAASYFYYPAIILTENARQIDLSEIDKLICSIVDPWGIGVPEDKLIAMGYPSENLSMVDDDWF
jgi:hypothetical protein